MTSGYTLVASPLFRLSRQRLQAFLTEKYSAELADKTLAGIKEQITTTLPTQPLIAPISERLFKLGLTEYRQWQLDKHNLLFYQVDTKQQQLDLLLLMDSRQNVQKLLYELTLLL